MRKLSYFVLIVGVFAGCARFSPQPISPERAANEFQERTLAEPGLKKFLETNLHTNLSVWPLPQWDLSHLTLAAFYYSPELDLARAKWLVAKAGKSTAAERPNPSLSVAPAYDTTTTIPSPWLVTAVLDLPIETAGKRGYRMAQADELSQAARFDIATTAWQVRSKLRRSLLDLYAASRTQALLEQQKSIQAENTALLERQFQAGEVSAFELTQARLSSDSTQLSLRDAEAQKADALIQVADIIGVPASALAPVRLNFDDFERLPVDLEKTNARRQALLNRSDILGALAEYAASQSALQLEIAKQYPDIHLNPGYEFDQGDSKWSLGFTLTLPLLNQNKGPIAEAQARRVQSAANFNAIQAKALAEIDRAFAGYEAMRQKRAVATSLLSNSRKQEKTAQLMYDAGETSKADLTAQRVLLSANAVSYVDTQVRLQQALGQIEEALQSPIGYSAASWENVTRTAGNRKTQIQ